MFGKYKQTQIFFIQKDLNKTSKPSDTLPKYEEKFKTRFFAIFLKVAFCYLSLLEFCFLVYRKWLASSLDNKNKGTDKHIRNG